MWFTDFLSPDRTSGRIALVVLGSAAAIGAGIYYMASSGSSSDSSQDTVPEESQRQEQSSSSPSQEAVAVQQLVVQPRQQQQHQRRQIFVSEMEAERFATLLILLVMCVAMVLSTVDRVAPTDYRLFVPLLMTGTGLYGASKIPSSNKSPFSKKIKRDEEEEQRNAIPTAAPSSKSQEEEEEEEEKEENKEEEETSSTKDYMDKALGKWKLNRNEKFSDFLSWVGYGWAVRRLALAASVEVTITKNPDNTFRKQVVSSFYTTDENIVVDGEWHQIDKLKKRHRVTKDDNGAMVLKTDIQGKTHQWTERIQINEAGTEMRNTYIWKDSSSGGTGSCVQIFSIV